MASFTLVTIIFLSMSIKCILYSTSCRKGYQSSYIRRTCASFSRLKTLYSGILLSSCSTGSNVSNKFPFSLTSLINKFKSSILSSKTSVYSLHSLSFSGNLESSNSFCYSKRLRQIFPCLIPAFAAAN